MPTSSTDPTNDHALAARLATGAGQVLIELRAELAPDGPIEDPERARSLKDLGDRRSHDWLMASLSTMVPGDAVLSEEAIDDPVRLDADRVWIIDPLDGTREFGEPPRSDWAVHVALVVGTRPVAGAVALPALGITLATDPAPAPPLPMSTPGVPKVIVSRTRPPAAASFVAEELGAELVTMGSAGAKAMAVVRGEADIYVHSGGQYEWDSCAPVAVAEAAGLHTSRLDGSPLAYNQPDPYLPDLVICRRELADDVLGVLSRWS